MYRTDFRGAELIHSLSCHPISHLASDMMDEKFKDTAQTDVQLESKEGWSENKIDPIAEKRLVRKLDWILLPLSTFACMSIPFVNRISFVSKHAY
jgi:hypothetical protein